MSISMALFTYLNAWFVSLFFTLPFFARTPRNSEGLGYAAAPETPAWRRVLTINSLLALMLTGVLAIVMSSGLISLRPE